ncbi:hypothetical protein J1N35_020764 [Gossypium stocksii]|uniref:glucose-6-phosphate 1-epimerase n=1 Tax=Gossypium stocksii TaxID=47602 RepID=A0A9D3VD17_9ROSI|nr:hypothetical protein J1N35_020764 [Gossypium stocksii]
MGHSAAVWDYRAATEITKDWNGVEKIVLRSPRGASARVSLHGGQVTSWRNDQGEELLFTSSKAIFKPPKAVRGGIPICFPQFGNCGSLEQHGFARNKIWTVDENPPPLSPNDSHAKSFIDLLLIPSEEDLKCWPHSFEFRLRVSLAADESLALISRIRNVNGKPFSFSFAYHTYLSVSDISEVRIEGLETLDYLDNLCQKERFTEQGDAITFESEVDRVYLGSPNVVAVLDHERKRTYVIRKDGLPDVVVWNPWEKKSKSMVDFGDDEYKQMLCVDGAVIKKPVTLKPVVAEPDFSIHGKWRSAKLKVETERDSGHIRGTRWAQLSTHLTVHLRCKMNAIIGQEQVGFIAGRSIIDNVLWNGVPTKKFRPIRSIRQGCPLSPYLFVLCIEWLGHRFHGSISAGEWNPIRLSRTDPNLLHLFFANDPVIFSQADLFHSGILKVFLSNFCELSGHKVNAQKTNVFFSSGVNESLRSDINIILGFQEVNDLCHYLEVPLFHRRVINSNLDFLVKRVCSRLSSWDAKKLSFAGRVTLA